MEKCKNCGGNLHYCGDEAISGKEILHHFDDDEPKCLSPCPIPPAPKVAGILG